MDTSFWTTLKPTVKIIDTTKIFYGKYVFKAEIYVPYAYSIRNNGELDSKPRSFRRTWNKYYDLNGLVKLPVAFDSSQVQYYISLTKTANEHLMIRLSDCKVIIFSDDEAVLYNVVKSAPNIEMKLISIHRPKNQCEAELLIPGNILVTAEPEYKYKVTLREKFINVQTKQQLLHYLEGLGDEVRVPPSCRKLLLHKHEWFSAGYIYANNTDIQVFLELICPGLVSGIFKLTPVDR